MSKSESARDQLRQSLTQLHAQLSATPRVDATARRLLREVLSDIERLLGASGDGRNEAGVAAAAGGAVSAPQRLEALAVEFEARHPALSGALRQFVDLLGRAGL
ncbi:MAG TPA: DUF4404 family protein [Steroidobacteraceae bacterium]|jgi:hypothetical protein|nr:DUF4404 family protein [Steroidobacteraceae bacterium]